MRWYVLEPEVPGGLGEQTAGDWSVHPPRITSLHFHFDDWLGDELIESFPCFAVTRELGQRLIAGGLNGFRLALMTVTVSDEFLTRNPDSGVPPFEWLQVDGTTGENDFGKSPDHKLIVSERVMRVLEGGRLNHCTIADWIPDNGSLS